MLSGVPAQARWVRTEPRRSLPAPLLDRVVRAAFPRSRVLDAEPLCDGLRNANFKLRLDSAPEHVVLRIYEHDASLCRKEIDLLRLVSGTVPVAEVLDAGPHGLDDLPPFALFRWIDGVTFRELKRSRDQDAIAQAAFAAGEVLAGLARFSFPHPGWIGPGPAVGDPVPEGPDPVPRFMDQCLSSETLRLRLSSSWRERVHEIVWAWAPRLAELCREARLVHGDFNKRNLLMKRSAGQWHVAALLDWESAVAGSPLADFGTFLRYEGVEPHFSSGYAAAGGVLPPDWRSAVGVIDLVALCESLTHDHLPDVFVPELLHLVETFFAPGNLVS